METIDIWGELLKMGVVFVLMGIGVWYQTNRLNKKDGVIDQLQSDLKDYSKDYREMSIQSLRIMTLIDDKLKTDAGSNENIKDIHRMVSRLLEIQEKRG